MMKIIALTSDDEDLLVRALANYKKKQRQRERNAVKYEKPDLVRRAQSANANADAMIARIENTCLINDGCEK